MYTYLVVQVVGCTKWIETISFIACPVLMTWHKGWIKWLIESMFFKWLYIQSWKKSKKFQQVMYHMYQTGIFCM